MEIELPFIPDRIDLLDFKTGVGYRYENKDPERSKREDSTEDKCLFCGTPHTPYPRRHCDYC